MEIDDLLQYYELRDIHGFIEHRCLLGLADDVLCKMVSAHIKSMLMRNLQEDFDSIGSISALELFDEFINLSDNISKQVDKLNFNTLAKILIDEYFKTEKSTSYDKDEIVFAVSGNDLKYILSEHYIPHIICDGIIDVEKSTKISEDKPDILQFLKRYSNQYGVTYCPLDNTILVLKSTKKSYRYCFEYMEEELLRLKIC